MLKKVLAGLITAVLSLGVVALVAGPASAHHNTIWPEVACATDGTYKITWSVQNSENAKSEVIVQSSNTSVVPVNETFGFGETKYFTQYVTEVKDYSLTLRGFWADGNVYNDSTGTLTKGRFPTGCITVTPEATPSPSVCDGPNHYTDPSYTLKPVTGVVYTVDGVVKSASTYPAANGSTVHIVATVSDPKYKITGTSTWDFTFKAPDETCTVKVEPVQPDIHQQACSGPGDHTLAEYFIPDTTGVLYYSKINGVETLRTTGWYPVPDGVVDFQVIAKPDSAKYYVFTDGSSSKIYDLTVIPAGTCLVDVEPKQPKADDAVCTGPGVFTPTQLTLYYVEHVVYQVTVNGASTAYPITKDTVIPLAQGDVVSVTATVDDGSKYQIKPKNWSFSHTFAAPGDCKVIIEEVEPDPTNQFCDDSVTPRVVVPGTVTIFPADNVEYFLDGKLTAPGTYDVTPGDHEITISFDATKYKLGAGAHTFPYRFTIEPGQCLPTHPLLTPLTTSTQIGCFTAGSYTLSNSIGDADAVIWTVNGSQVAQGKYTVTGSGTVSITATPNAPDYGFNPGVQTSWTIDFQKPSVCDVETLAYTGQSPTGLLIAADLLVVTGLALFAMRAVRRGRSQTD